MPESEKVINRRHDTQQRNRRCPKRNILHRRKTARQPSERHGDESQQREAHHDSCTYGSNPFGYHRVNDSEENERGYNRESSPSRGRIFALYSHPFFQVFL